MTANDTAHVPQRVLIVDDDEAARTILARMLTHDGFKVQAVGSAEAAAEMAAAFKPHVLVVDWMLGDGTALDATAGVRTTSPNVAVFLISGVPRYELHREGVDALGEHQWFEKPFDFQEFRIALRKCLENGAATDGHRPHLDAG